jgi:hypothetical protein
MSVFCFIAKLPFRIEIISQQPTKINEKEKKKDGTSCVDFSLLYNYYLDVVTWERNPKRKPRKTTEKHLMVLVV